MIEGFSIDELRALYEAHATPHYFYKTIDQGQTIESVLIDAAQKLGLVDPQIFPFTPADHLEITFPVSGIYQVEGVQKTALLTVSYKDNMILVRELYDVLEIMAEVETGKERLMDLLQQMGVTLD